MSGYRKPDAEGVKAIMRMLFGEDVAVTPAAAPPPAGPVASFVDPDGRAVAAAQCDVAFGAYAGAALSMIPPAGAEDAVAEGRLSDGMTDNLHEVMNICSKLFMDDQTPHLRLDRMYAAADEVPDEVQAVLGGTAADLLVGIPRYGDGVIRLSVA